MAFEKSPFLNVPIWLHHSVATLDSFSNPNTIFVRYYVYLFETLLRHKIWIFFVKDGKRYSYYIHFIRCLIHTNDTFFIQLYYRWFNRIELDPIIQNAFHSSELLVMHWCRVFFGERYVALLWITFATFPLHIEHLDPGTNQVF